MENQITADRRGAAGVRNGIRRGQSQNRECKGANQSGLCTHTSLKVSFHPPFGRRLRWVLPNGVLREWS